MTDLKNLQPLGRASKGLPFGRDGRPISRRTLLRWIKFGVIGPHGRRVHLEAVRLGNRWLIDEHAVDRFAARLTPSSCAALPGTPQDVVTL